MGFHLGAIKSLEATAVDLETGKVNQTTLDQFKIYRDLMRRLLTRYNLAYNNDLMTKLHAGGSVELTSSQCLQANLVDELF